MGARGADGILAFDRMFKPQGGLWGRTAKGIPIYHAPRIERPNLYSYLSSRALRALKSTYVRQKTEICMT